MRPEDLGIGRLFEKALAAVIVADAETQQVVLWNPVARDMLGYSLSEALELRVEALVPTHLKAGHRAGMIRYEERGTGTISNRTGCWTCPP
jgi:PAS domain S-box-containing protein